MEFVERTDVEMRVFRKFRWKRDEAEELTNRITY